MSQPSSSMISTDNAEVKYKKALKEISKLISANRVLRETNQKSTNQLKQKINQLSLRYEDLEKQYDSVRKEKQSVTRYLDQLQKQRNNHEREIAYLNDVLAEQNAQLKKFNMHKDQRAVAALIRTYEQKQSSMNRQLNNNEQMIKKLKLTVERLQGQIQSQRNQKQENQQRYRGLSLDMSKYKQQNFALHEQIQRLLKESQQKGSYSIQKQRQIRSLMVQFQKQIGILKNVQDQSSRYPKNSQIQGYEQLLNEKNKLTLELTRLQTAYEQQILRQKDYFEMQQKMKTTKLIADRANQQINMLKSKIVVLQAKQFLQEAGDDDYDQKFFQQRLNLLVAQNDPLNSIKNHEDSSHFRILKSFIVDLQDKIYKINSEKKQVSRKYKSIKTKFVKNAQQLSQLQDQNKLLRGKLQGFERLTQKLQFQLERAISGHQDEITRMTITSNNIITKKVEEYKTTINFLNSQLQMNQDKSSRTQKNYKQQIETLRLELDTLKIKFRDQTEKGGKDNQLIEIYKRKNNQISNRINTLQEQLANSNQNLSKFQQLFKQQKGKNQGLISQKQQLLTQNRQLTQQIDKKSSNFNSSTKLKQDQYQFQIRKLKGDNQRLKDQSQQAARKITNLQKQLQQIRRGDQSQVTQIKKLTYRNTQVEAKVGQLKRRIRQLQQQNDTIKIKSKKFQQNYEKIVKYEEDNINKGDRISDLTRQKITLQNELKNLQSQLNDEVRLNEQLKRQLGGLKIKSLQSTHENKKQFQVKIFQNKKTIQSLNQQISDLTTQLKQQKSKNLRLNNQINNVKQDRNRIQQLAQQNRKRDLQNQQQIGNVKIQLSNAQMEIQKLQSDVRNHQSIVNNLNTQLQTLQQTIFSLNQTISNLKMKLQTAQDLKSDLIRDLNALKFNLSSCQTHANKSKANLNIAWEQQTFLNNLIDVFSKIKRICKNYGITIQSTNASFSYQTSAQPIYTSTAKTTTVIVQDKPKGNEYFSYFKSYAGQQSPAKNTQTNQQNSFSSYQVTRPIQTDYRQNVVESSLERKQVKAQGNGYLQYFNSYAGDDSQNQGSRTKVSGYPYNEWSSSSYNVNQLSYSTPGAENY